MLSPPLSSLTFASTSRGQDSLINAPGPAFGIGNTGFEPAVILGRLEVLNAFIELFPLFHIGITVPLNNVWAFIKSFTGSQNIEDFLMFSVLLKKNTLEVKRNSTGTW